MLGAWAYGVAPILLSSFGPPAEADMERSFRLKNQLLVVLERHPHSPRFALAIAYRAGARHDPPDRAQLAHLTEHLTYRHLKGYFQRAEAGAASFNGFTSPETTLYFVSDHDGRFEGWLWDEARRMTRLEVSPEVFGLEQKIVMRELEEYAELVYEFRERSLERLLPPDRRPATRAESQSDLKRLTLSDVAWFHRRYYRPENAVLVIVTPRELGEVEALVRQVFGPFPGPAEAPSPLPTAPVREPAPEESRCAAGVMDVESPMRFRSIHVMYLVRDQTYGPGFWLASRVAHQRINELLSEAEVLHEMFPEETTPEREDALLGISALLRGGVTASRLAAALQEELAGLLGRPIDGDEFDQAKATVRSRLTDEFERPLGRARSEAARRVIGLPSRAELMGEIDGFNIEDLSRVWKAIAEHEPLIVSHNYDDKRRRLRISGAQPCR